MPVLIGSQNYFKMKKFRCFMQIAYSPNNALITVSCRLRGGCERLPQEGAVVQTLKTGEDRDAAGAPEQVGAGCRGIAPQGIADKGTVGQAQHSRLEMGHDLARQSDLANRKPGDDRGEDRMGAGLQQRQQAQLGKAAVAARGRRTAEVPLQYWKIGGIDR